MTYSPNRSEGKSSLHWGIGVNVHYIPVHTQPYYQAMGFAEGDYPQAERYYRAEAPFIRPASLADDHTGTHAVVRHAIAWQQAQGRPVAYACCIYATAPFVQVRYLREGFEKLVASGKSYVFSVTRFAFPIQRAIRLNARGEVEALFPEHIFSRSQDLEEAYHDAGQFYWGRAQAYLEGVVAFSSTSLPVILPRHLVQDIDTLEDWRRAELMYQALQLDRGEA